MADLPSIIPIFPLPNVILFPQVMLPLHIFEPRYRQMVRDAETRRPPLIGMTLLRGNWQEQYEGTPDIYPIGCAGEMVRVNPLPDGRFNVMLQGMYEFSIIEESATKSYREAKVEWRPSSRESLAVEERAELHRLLKCYLQNNEKVQQFLNDSSIEDGFLVNFFAFHLDFTPIEKQGLLEAVTLPERAERLRDMLDFKLSEAQWTEGAGGAGKNRLH
jgi:uncharacterized protein